jgi:hypothetical protein
MSTFRVENCHSPRSFRRTASSPGTVGNPSPASSKSFCAFSMSVIGATSGRVLQPNVRSLTEDDQPRITPVSQSIPTLSLWCSEVLGQVGAPEPVCTSRRPMAVGSSLALVNCIACRASHSELSTSGRLRTRLAASSGQVRALKEHPCSQNRDATPELRPPGR